MTRTATSILTYGHFAPSPSDSSELWCVAAASLCSEPEQLWAETTADCSVFEPHPVSGLYCGAGPPHEPMCCWIGRGGSSLETTTCEDWKNNFINKFLHYIYEIVALVIFNKTN